MKKAVIISLMIFLNVFSYGQKKGPVITVYSVNIFTRTIVDVPCNEFMTAFQGRIDTSACYYKDSVDAVDDYLRRIRYAKGSGNIDTRIKFVCISRSGKITNICMDNFGISVNGRIIDQYPEFYKYLCSLVPKKQFIASSQQL